VQEDRDESAPERDLLAERFREAQAGDPKALGQLLEACRLYLLKIANGELPQELWRKIDASDVVQDTLLEAQRDLPQFVGGREEEFLAWVRRILLNNIANARRQYQQTAKRDVARERSLDADDSAGFSAAQLPATADRSLGSAVAQEEQLRRLDEALSRLPQHLWEVLILRHRENKSFAEIGELIGRSPDAARKRWARAVEQLQRELGE
jgi:RNA polymerase sigma-70 factor (ECF subfamily)